MKTLLILITMTALFGCATKSACEPILVAEAARCCSDGVGSVCCGKRCYCW